MTRGERYLRLVQSGMSADLADRCSGAAANLAPLGVTVTFSSDEDVLGHEPDESVRWWAQADHPERVAIFQGPVRDLHMWTAGLGWGLWVAAQQEQARCAANKPAQAPFEEVRDAAIREGR